jgi:aspartate/methionine/tyrosine aminotransferase
LEVLHLSLHIARPEITPFLAMDILERAQELGRRAPVIRLEVGQPDWDTPGSQEAFAAMQRGETQCTHSMTLELRGGLPTLSENVGSA